MEHNWNGRPYHSLDWELKHTSSGSQGAVPVRTGKTCIQ